MNTSTCPLQLTAFFIALQMPLYTLSFQKSLIEEHTAYTTKYMFQELLRDKPSPIITTLSPHAKKIFFEVVFYGSCAVAGICLSQWIMSKKSKTSLKVYRPGEIRTKFSDVAVSHEVQEEFNKLIHFLKNPQIYNQAGGRLESGILLYGDPGNGKTLLAKALAGETNGAFMEMNGSQFIEEYVGTGAKRIRELFSHARQHIPCIIFIDEIDAVGAIREHGRNNQEHTQALNALLSEIGGFSSDKYPILVLAATNRPQVLDKALIRSGRLGKRINIRSPNREIRKKMLEIHLRGVKVTGSVDLSRLADLTEGFSGADLFYGVVNPTVVQVVYEKQQAVSITQHDLEVTIKKFREQKALEQEWERTIL